jgi:uncharacterized protein (TIGR00369 family)
MMKVLPHTHSCFVCGESNPIGFNLRFETDGKIITARFVARREHAGFQEVVHGGLIATLLDEVMVWACAVSTRRFAYCAELKVRFLQPLRPGEPAIVSAQLAANRKNRIFEAEGSLKNEKGVTLATSTGKYLPIGEGEAAKLAQDFVPSASALQQIWAELKITSTAA